jgi:HAMP domain-containing protein
MQHSANTHPYPSTKVFIALAGSILMVFLLGGSVAAFGLFYAAEQQQEDQQRLDATFHSADEISSAAIAFKRQVQEWKNILLRGADPGDYSHYRQSFEKESEQVNRLLSGLGDSSEDNQKTSIGALLDEHSQLTARYRELLGANDHITPSLASEIDHTLLGIDRPFTERLDAFAETLRNQLKSIHQEGREAELKRYQTLKRLNVAVTSLGTLLVFALLFWFRPRTTG